MCATSFVMEHAMTIPRETWTQPYWQENFEDLLRKAKKYDEEHNQPNCALDEKRLALKKIAKEMRVEIKFP